MVFELRSAGLLSSISVFNVNFVMCLANFHSQSEERRGVIRGKKFPWAVMNSEWDWECSSVKFIENNQEYHQRTSLLKVKGKGEPERENLLSFFSDGRLHPRKNCEKKLCKMFFKHRRGREASFFF